MRTLTNEAEISPRKKRDSKLIFASLNLDEIVCGCLKKLNQSIVKPTLKSSRTKHYSNLIEAVDLVWIMFTSNNKSQTQSETESKLTENKN